MSLWPTWRENPLFTVLCALVCVALFIFLGVKTAQLNKPVPMERTIFVEGIGKVTMSPDIAVINVGLTSTQNSVAEAQTQNSTLMNALIEKIKGAGVAEADLQTKDYSAYEKTEWNPTTQRSVGAGWVVSQTLQVKIRDLQKISAIIEIAGQGGSTSISGPTFTVDDQKNYETAARTKALEDARVKAMGIAQSLGLKLVQVVGYNEYKDGTAPMPYLSMDSKAMGGSVMTSAPDIQAGSQEMSLHATVTYLLAQ